MEVIRKVFKQTSWQILGKIATSLSTILILSIITRNYGQAETGIFTLAQAYIAFFYLAVDLGLNGYFLPKVDSDKQILNQLFSFRIVISLPLILLALVLQYFLGYKNLDFIFCVMIFSLTILFNGVFTSANLIFQKNLRYDLSTWVLALNSLTTILIVYLFSIYNYPIYFLAVGVLMGWLINNLVTLVVIKKIHTFKLVWPKWSFLKPNLKQAWPISLTLLLNVFYFRTDTFVLAHFRSFAETGIYNVAYQIFQSVLVLPTFILNSYYPIMTMSFKQNLTKFLSQFKIALIILFVIGCLGNIVTIYLSPLIIQLLTGSQFTSSILPLQILSSAFPAFFVSGLLMWALIILGKYKIMLAIYALAFLFNLILNFMYIPQHSYIAAAIITSLSEYLILICEAVIVFKYLKVKNHEI